MFTADVSWDIYLVRMVMGSCFSSKVTHSTEDSGLHHT